MTASEEAKLKSRLAAVLHVLEIREGELRDRLGPCSHAACQLHSAHSGPCYIPNHLQPSNGHIIEEQP